MLKPKRKIKQFFDMEKLRLSPESANIKNLVESFLLHTENEYLYKEYKTLTDKLFCGDELFFETNKQFLQKK